MRFTTDKSASVAGPVSEPLHIIISWCALWCPHSKGKGREGVDTNSFENIVKSILQFIATLLKRSGRINQGHFAPNACTDGLARLW